MKDASFTEQIRSLSKAQQVLAIADFLFLKVTDQIKRSFGGRIKQLAGNLVSYSPAAELEIEQIMVEAVEDHPEEEEPAKNVMGWAVWKAGEINGNFHFDIAEDNHIDVSWLTVTISLPTETEERDKEEEW